MTSGVDESSSGSFRLGARAMSADDVVEEGICHRLGRVVLDWDHLRTSGEAIDHREDVLVPLR